MHDRPRSRSNHTRTPRLPLTVGSRPSIASPAARSTDPTDHPRHSAAPGEPALLHLVVDGPRILYVSQSRQESLGFVRKLRANHSLPVPHFQLVRAFVEFDETATLSIRLATSPSAPRP